MNKRFACAVLGIALAGCQFGDNRYRTVDDVEPGPDASVPVPPSDAPPPPPDEDVEPVPSSCDPVEQAGCAANAACDLAGDIGTATACRAVTVPGSSNDRCASDTQCAAGYTCAADEVDPSVRWCHRMCAANADCGSYERCAYTLEDANGAPQVRVCSNACNPVTSGGCPAATGCTVVEAGATDFTNCVVRGAGLEGDGCAADDECVPGAACITRAGASTCQWLCEIGGSDCAVGQVCGSLNPSISVAGKTLGACL